MIIDIHDVWSDAAASHEAFLRTVVQEALQKEYNVVGPIPYFVSAVSKFIERNLDALVDVDNHDFVNVIDDYVATFPPGTNLQENAVLLFKKIFNYDAFRDERDSWGAYSLCNMARYVVCPYCHIRTTNTILRDEVNAGYRPQLDHFYDRARYPFLALSLGNLVPCCGTCNGPGMKHMKDFIAQPHLNPLCDMSLLSFMLAPANGAEWDPVLRALRAPVENYEVQIVFPVGNVKAQNSLRTFQLYTQYQTKISDAFRVAKLGCSPAYSRSASLATGLDVHEMTISEHLGFDPEGNAYKNKSEGKMRRDIYFAFRN